eukprot:TRINITY_DN16201_c0_g1_i6.p4 TRINITY_DN16201_c0_g1~~TRINITY_DN16201_c0_g1_i6.p4  ORF type:complete len:165 (-),score=12.22 TRINITY_DN16201_c0_g1_i6:3101-3595(-)
MEKKEVFGSSDLNSGSLMRPEKQTNSQQLPDSPFDEPQPELNDLQETKSLRSQASQEPQVVHTEPSTSQHPPQQARPPIPLQHWSQQQSNRSQKFMKHYNAVLNQRLGLLNAYLRDKEEEKRRQEQLKDPFWIEDDIGVAQEIIIQEKKPLSKIHERYPSFHST